MAKPQPLQNCWGGLFWASDSGKIWRSSWRIILISRKNWKNKLLSGQQPSLTYHTLLISGSFSFRSELWKWEDLLCGSPPRRKRFSAIKNVSWWIATGVGVWWPVNNFTVPTNTFGDGGASPAGRSLTRLFWRIDVLMVNNEGQRLKGKTHENQKKMVRSDHSSKAFRNVLPFWNFEIEYR